jgi:hypothetical protein
MNSSVINPKIQQSTTSRSAMAMSSLLKPQYKYSFPFELHHPELSGVVCSEVKK